MYKQLNLNKFKKLLLYINTRSYRMFVTLHLKLILFTWKLKFKCPVAIQCSMNKDIQLKFCKSCAAL